MIVDDNCNCIYQGSTFSCPTHSHWAIKIKQQQELIDKLTLAESLLERVYRGLEEKISTVPESLVHKDMVFYFKTKKHLQKD